MLLILLKHDVEWGISSMKKRDYLFDKMYLILFGLLSLLVLWVFLTTLRIQFEVRVVVSTIYIALVVLVLCVEYFKRKSYYNRIEVMMKDLDQKFLISEMLPTPTFIDAVLMQDIITGATKSMADSIATHQNNVSAYVDYIELWIHEIKTPLAALSLIVENRPSEDKRSILKEVKQIQDYLDQILFYARTSSLEDDMVIKEVVLKDLVHEVVRDMSLMFIEKGIRLSVDIDEELVYVDPKWFQFMIKQILDNAVKYTRPQEGVVRVFVRSHNNSVSLHIHDNGIGIADYDIGRVFNRGFTGARGDLHKQATGMGLYLVKSMADKMGMHVAIESDNGVHVTLVIPKSEMFFRDSYNNVR